MSLLSLALLVSLLRFELQFQLLLSLQFLLNELGLDAPVFGSFALYIGRVKDKNDGEGYVDEYVEADDSQ